MKSLVVRLRKENAALRRLADQLLRELNEADRRRTLIPRARWRLASPKMIALVTRADRMLRKEPL